MQDVKVKEAQSQIVTTEPTPTVSANEHGSENRVQVTSPPQALPHPVRSATVEQDPESSIRSGKELSPSLVQSPHAAHEPASPTYLTTHTPARSTTNGTLPSTHNDSADTSPVTKPAKQPSKPPRHLQP